MAPRLHLLPHETATFAPLAELSPLDVHDLLRLRQEVFVVEQSCLYADADGRDPDARHLLVRDERGSLLAVLRVLEPGVRFAERSIGRVVVHPSARGTGLGRAIVAEAIRRIDRSDGPAPIRLSAQAHLERLYGSLGFVRDSDVYDEDGIPHIEMARAPTGGESL